MDRMALSVSVSPRRRQLQPSHSASPRERADRVKLVVSSPKRRQLQPSQSQPQPQQQLCLERVDNSVNSMQTLVESPRSLKRRLPIPDTPNHRVSTQSQSQSQSQCVTQYTVGQRVLVVPVGHHPLRLSAVVTQRKGSYIRIQYEHFVYADDEDSERLHIADDAHRIVADLGQDLMDDTEMEQLHNAMSRRCTSVGTVMSMASAVSAAPTTTRAGVERECVVCMAEQRSYACIPCGHLCLCGKCKDELFDKTCPICQQKYDCFIKIYS